MRLLVATASILAILSASVAASAQAPESRDAPKPTIVLVHGAFAGSSSWNSVVTDLTNDGYKVIAVANPLRSVKGDAAYVASLVRTISGPVVLVGHSYGGEVVSVAAADQANVKALVFVAGFAPEVGESAAQRVQAAATSVLLLLIVRLA